MLLCQPHRAQRPVAILGINNLRFLYLKQIKFSVINFFLRYLCVLYPYVYMPVGFYFPNRGTRHWVAELFSADRSFQMNEDG